MSEYVVLTRPARLKAAARRLLVRKLTIRLAQATLTGAELAMFDDVTVSLLPHGAPAYAGYVAGSYANWGALTATFEASGAYLLSITPYLGPFAQCLDIEPGDASIADAPPFWQQVKDHVPVKPWLYTSASNLAALQNTMTAAGIPRSAYFIWAAHYIGPHLCGPSTCGYGISAADATQYTSTYGGQSLDASLVRPYCIQLPVPPVPPPPSPSPPSVEDDKMPVAIPPQLPAPAPDILSGVSFDGPAAYKTIGFLADPGALGGGTVTVRCAFHGNGGAVWNVLRAVMTAAAPKAVITVPDWADGVSFSREDNLNIVLYPNFA